MPVLEDGRTMRILFVTSNCFIPEHASGQNRTLMELCRRLARSGHEPVVLSNRAEPHGRGSVVQEQAYGFRLIRAGTPMQALATVAVTLRPDAVVIFDGNYEGLMQACAPLKLPVAVWFFQAEPFYFRNSEPDPQLLYLATSPFLVRRIQRLFGTSVELLPPYIELEDYRRDRQGSRVLFVNPVREKGVEILFELARRRPRIAFTVVESWGLAAAWRKLCFERALRCGNIEWIPKSLDMQSAFDNARMLLLPRYTEEGYCRLVSEAQAGGLPVLASDRGNLPDNVGAGGAVLSVDADLDLWLERIDAYTQAPEVHRDVALQARQHSARPEIDPDRVADRFMRLIEQRVADFSGGRYGRRN